MGRSGAVAAAVLLCSCGGQLPAADDSADLSAQVEARTAFGDALPGLSAPELDLFNAGKVAFAEVESAADGLGPVFNEASCVACHQGPAPGGSNGRLETRFGRVDGAGNFDPLASLGGSLLQDHGIGPVQGWMFGAEQIPTQANVIARRRTTPLFGLGLVDATPDAVFHGLAAAEKLLAPDAAGTVALVADLSSQKMAVGKFGWKNGNPTLFQFSADAYLNEMGFTSPLFPKENCPQGDCASLEFNPRPDLNDPDGADVLKFAHFMTFLAPPPRGPRTLQTILGEAVFAGIGCAICHTPTLVTGRNPVRALDRVAYHPFSDFLLHDMGSLGDGIVQGAAGARQMRTQPLWGVRASATLLHDGRAATLEQAIQAHDGQGRRSRDRFAALDRLSRAALIAFLKSL